MSKHGYVIAIITIISMGCAIYTTRMLGYCLVGFINLNFFMRAWLNNLPGTVLVSLIAPDLLDMSIGKVFAISTVIIMMRVTKNYFFSILTGVVVINIGRF